MLLGNGFLPMFAVAGGGGLTGATWALDGSGRARCTPTLGSELLTNGGFETGNPPTGWTAVGTPTTREQSTGQVHSGTYAMRIVADSVDDGFDRNTTGLTVNTWYSASEWLYRQSGTDVRMAAQSIIKTAGTINGQWVQAIIVQRGVTAILLRAYSLGANEFYADDFSIKAVTLPTTLATIAGTSATQTAAAKIHTLTTGTQAGVVSLLDSASNPQNFLIAYHDGTNVKLDKCVGGTYTSLISTAVAFSSNAQIEIRRPSGNTFQLWYGGSQRGTDQTVSDAGIISNTLYGLFSTYSGNLFSEFTLDGAVIPFGF